VFHSSTTAVTVAGVTRTILLMDRLSYLTMLSPTFVGFKGCSLWTGTQLLSLSGK